MKKTIQRFKNRVRFYLKERKHKKKLKEIRNHDLQKLKKGDFHNQEINLNSAKPFEKNKKGITKDDWKNHLRMIENM